MERQVFVARDRELGQLDSFLDRALVRQGTVCFVTGEAGSGKTALVTEFARRAQEQHGDLVVAVGQSDAQTGGGDAYLPFREVLSQLTGDVEAELARGAITQENAGRLRGLLRLSGQALVEVGPDLVGIFVPGAGLAMRVGGFVAEKVGWLEKLEQLTQRQREGVAPVDSGIEQSHIFEQYTNVLKALAAKQPLMLVLDDLQWADGASMDLLFRLGRRIGESRILIVGTYRPDEVALGRPSTGSGQVERHPLEKVLAEFKRYFGDVRVDLAKAQEDEGERFVDAMVDTEPNRLGEGFRQALYHHTGGHPLFTIELLRDMQERGDLVQDEAGRWTEGPVLDWEDLPARVEGVIEERVGRLERELREALSVASVEGEDFTAEVVAGVQTADARGLIRRLSGELEKQHRLVSARGVQRLDGQRLSLYRFQHNLFQTYLYSELDEIERVCLHEDVGRMLEELYGDQADDIAIQLARHFVEAGIPEKARVYLRRVGELAAARYANDEAVDYFTRALALTPQTDVSERYDLLSSREKVYGLQAAREAQADDLDVLRRLAGDLDDNGKRAEVALRTAALAHATGDYERSLAATQEAIRLASAGRDIDREARAYSARGMTLIEQGQHDKARTRLEHALGLAEGAALHRSQSQTLMRLARILSQQGELEAATARYREALRICERLNDLPGERAAVNGLGICSVLAGDFETASEYFEQTLERSQRIGDRRRVSIALHNLGGVATECHDFSAARKWFRRSLRNHVLSGDQANEAMTLGALGSVSLKLGLYCEAGDHLQRSLEISERIGKRQNVGSVSAWLGMLSWFVGEHEVACAFGERALDIAREVAVPALEAHALEVLGHGLEGLSKWEKAGNMYRQAVAIYRASGSRHDAASDSAAGLARVSLACGDLTTALQQVEEILVEFKDGNVAGADFPLAAYLACFKVLEAVDDPRAQETLNTAHSLLQDQAAKIEDEALRRSFLENVAAHREIVHEFVRSQQAARQAGEGAS
jgi:adenylate cyclase